MESSRRAEDERAALEEPGTESPSEWLPAGMPPPLPPAPPPEAEVAAPGPPPTADDRDPEPIGGEAGEPSAQALEPGSALAEWQQGIERRIEDVLRLQEQNARQQSTITEATEALHARVEALEGRVAELASGDVRADTLERAADYQQSHRAGPVPADGERVDLNAADFDELRALGLSITQAARLIARRDAVDGFSSEEEVAALPGFPRQVLEGLLARTRL